MDLTVDDEMQAFTAELRQFLADNWPPRDGEDTSQESREREFRRKAIERGFLYRRIPRKYGGAEQPRDPIKEEIIRVEFTRARAPMEVHNPGVTHFLPTLLECGAEWQKDRFAAKTVNGEYRWAQGYSEPGAGSDLASIRTHAELHGGRWVINGQKIWTTKAHRCNFMFALVRTERDQPRHAGLSYLLLKLQQPGIVIRPLKQMTGDSEFCEVFFNDAVTPADWIIGERGNGWEVSRATLRYERDYLGGASRNEALFKSLLRLVKTTNLNGSPAIENPEVRRQLARIDGYLQAFIYSSHRAVSMSGAGQDPGMFTLMPKLFGSNFSQEIARLVKGIIGDDLLLMPPREGSPPVLPGNARWVYQFMGSLASAIAGGTSNIQRNIIAERGLGLPRD